MTPPDDHPSPPNSIPARSARRARSHTVPSGEREPATARSSANDLQQTLNGLLGRAQQRQVWMLLLDSRRRLVEPLIPMDELPNAPGEIVTTDDMGEVSFVRVLVDRIGSVIDAVGATALAVVWERTGSDRFTAQDLEWARVLVRQTGRSGVTVHGQFLLHDGGLRPITPDDYAR